MRVIVRVRAWLSAVVAAGVLAAIGLAAAEDRAALDPATAAAIDALFAEHAGTDSPGVAIGIVRHGALVFAKGYGAADLESGAPITADTAFNLASLSKQFTGAALAFGLVERRVDLDDPLAAHWPELPSFMAEITLGHLAYMTSGLPEYYTLPSPRGGWASEDGFTVDDAVAAVFAAGGLEFAPGSQWAYSNINYQLLALTAARLNETDFPTLLRTRVFAPLGMNQTWIDAPIQTDRADRATAYVRDEAEQTWRPARRLSPHYGGSGMFSSLRDLAAWDRALYTTKAFGPAFTDAMLARRPYDHDKTNDALGLVHGGHRGLATIWYEGGDYGVSTAVIRAPARDETVICLANFADAQCFAKARAVLDVIIDADAAAR